jgi:hypothetical protein
MSLMVGASGSRPVNKRFGGETRRAIILHSDGARVDRLGQVREKGTIVMQKIFKSRPIEK